MAQQLSATARRDKAARDKAYAMSPDRKAKKAHAEREARANPSAAKGKDFDHKDRDGKHLIEIEVTTERALKKKVVKNTTLNNMDKILKFFGSSVIGDIGKIIDDLFTSDEERDAAKHKIISVLKEKEIELQRMRTDIIIAEAKGNWLQRSWRPILMLSFGFIIIYNKFAAPLFGWPIPILEGEFWTLLQIGIGGYVVGRSAEKIADKINITRK